MRISARGIIVGVFVISWVCVLVWALFNLGTLPSNTILLISFGLLLVFSMILWEENPSFTVPIPKRKKRVTKATVIKE